MSSPEPSPDVEHSFEHTGGQMLFSPVETVLESFRVGCEKRQRRNEDESEDIAVVKLLQDFSRERRGGDSLGRQARGTQGTGRYVDVG